MLKKKQLVLGISALEGNYLTLSTVRCVAATGRRRRMGDPLRGRPKLLLGRDRNARFAPTILCVGRGGGGSDWACRKNGGSVL